MTKSAVCLYFVGPKEDADLLSRQLSETSVKNDTLQDISSSTSSTPKKANSESGVETGSSGNDTASVASSGSRHSLSSGIASRDEDVFEVPRTIRFPPAAPTKCYSEVVICKWELCGNEFDSTGKLLDHLKVIFKDFNIPYLTNFLLLPKFLRLNLYNFNHVCFSFFSDCSCCGRKPKR